MFSLTTNGVFTVLHEFDEVNGANPRAALVEASDGYLYGMTPNGGLGIGSFQDSDGYGTAFRMAVDGAFTMLHAFAGLDGAHPSGALIQAVDGNFYGVTGNGPDTSSPGSVFRLTATGAVTTIHTFHLNDSMAAFPGFGLLDGCGGNFYGTTYSGAWGGFCATIFHVTAAGGFDIVHRFGDPFPFPCFAGEVPSGPLVSGPPGVGYVFGVTAAHVFVLAGVSGLTNVATVAGGSALVFGDDGSLYGTSPSGVFKLGEGGLSQVHSFSAGEGSG